MLVNKEILRELCSEELCDGYETVEITFVQARRWSRDYRIIFKCEGRYYESFFSEGSTEYQDESPYEYSDQMIECNEVETVETMVMIYKRIEP